tara:strand:+ start:680 stop:1300 length:621 start_codon:yes stop_codon:yes gene_type:complete
MENFIMQFELDLIDSKICDDLIEYHKDNTDYKSKGETLYKNDKKSKDVHVGGNCQHPVIQKYMRYIIECTMAYKMRYDYALHELNLAEGFNIQYYPPEWGFPKWHNERSMQLTHQRALVFMTYLNDVEDGGGTEFKYQKLRFNAKKGTTLIWPPDFTHTHRGVISPTQEKYISTGWLIHCDVSQTLASEHQKYEELLQKYQQLLDK